MCYGRLSVIILIGIYCNLSFADCDGHPYKLTYQGESFYFDFYEWDTIESAKVISFQASYVHDEPIIFYLRFMDIKNWKQPMFYLEVGEMRWESDTQIIEQNNGTIIKGSAKGIPPRISRLGYFTLEESNIEGRSIAFKVGEMRALMGDEKFHLCGNKISV